MGMIVPATPDRRRWLTGTGLEVTWRQQRDRNPHKSDLDLGGVISCRDLPYLFLPLDTKTCRCLCSSRNDRATVAALPLVISITFVGVRFAPSSHPLSSILQPRSVTIRSEDERRARNRAGGSWAGGVDSDGVGPRGAPADGVGPGKLSLPVVGGARCSGP